MFRNPPQKHIFISISALALVCVVTLAAISMWQHAHSDALWKIVHGQCVLDMEQHQDPSPCASVGDGVAILKDKKGNTQYLAIPTEKIAGIESSAILKQDAVNYFSVAWDATGLVSQRAGRTLERTDFAVAINSISGRSQDQLHLHVDCIQPPVKSLLQKDGAKIQASWQKLPGKLMGHDYRAMWLPGAELGTRNPFQLLAASLQNPSKEMGGHTLVLAGAERSGEAGFILLDRKAPAFAVALSPWIKLGFGTGEELEDHSCRVATGR